LLRLDRLVTTEIANSLTISRGILGRVEEDCRLLYGFHPAKRFLSRAWLAMQEKSDARGKFGHVISGGVAT
jgi:hypothetical protein